MISAGRLLYYLSIIIGLIIISEGGAYFWHRIGAHTDIVLPEIHETHKTHHDANLDHQANQDFYWVLLGLAGIYTLFVLMAMTRLINMAYAIIIPTIISLVFISTWYIHRAYHIEDHWLNNYEWFKRKKKLHFNHHYDPDVNYGILTHIFDKLCGTYKEIPFDDNEHLNIDLKEFNQ